MAVTGIPPPPYTPGQTDWIAAYRQLRGLARQYSNAGQALARADARSAVTRISGLVARRFTKFGGDAKRRIPYTSDATRAEQAYGAIQGMLRQAEESHDAARADQIREALEDIRRYTTGRIDTLTRTYGALDTLTTQATRTTQATQAMLRPPATAGPPVTVASMTVPPPSQFDIPGPAYPIVAPLNPAYTESAGGLVHATDVPGPGAVSGLPGPSLAEAAGAEAGGLWRGWLDRPATVSGTTAAHPTATETIVTPSLAGASSLWLRPVDPAPGTAPVDSGLHHAGETVRPPPLTTTASSTAPAPGASFHVPAWVTDDFHVERAVLAGTLPRGFDASQLVRLARRLGEAELAEELAARRLPLQTIDRMIEELQAANESGRYTRRIGNLSALKASIERALLDAYPGRVDREWLDHVRHVELPRRHGVRPAPSAASAAGSPLFDATEILRLRGTGEGVSHPALLPPPSAAGRTGAGAGAPPPAAEPWRIRPPGMGGEPHPVAFDPRSAPPGPSSQVRPTDAIRTPVMSTEAPPGWQGAETPGFARAASGAVELPFSRREEIARRFRSYDAVLQAELVLQTGGGEALRWSATRWRPVLTDIERLHDTAEVDLAAAVAMTDIDWRAIEVLARILHVPLPSP